MKKKVTLSPERVKFLQAIAHGNTVHSAAAQAELLKYSPDEERDEHGRWVSGSSDSSNEAATSSKEPFVQTKNLSSKQGDLVQGGLLGLNEHLTDDQNAIKVSASNFDAISRASTELKYYVDQDPDDGGFDSNYEKAANSLIDKLDAALEEYSTKYPTTKIFKYSPDQPRDDHGRFAGGGQGGGPSSNSKDADDAASNLRNQQDAATGAAEIAESTHADAAGYDDAEHYQAAANAHASARQAFADLKNTYEQLGKTSSAEYAQRQMDIHNGATIAYMSAVHSVNIKHFLSL